MIKLKQINKAVTGEKIIFLYIPKAISTPSFENFELNVHYTKKRGNMQKNVCLKTFRFRRSLSKMVMVIPLLFGKKEKTVAIFGDLVFRNKLSTRLLILVDAKRTCCSAKTLRFRRNISQGNLH